MFVSMNNSDSCEKHWQALYSAKKHNELTWYQNTPQVSLDFIKDLHLDKSADLLDVGAGASKWVDYLLQEGYTNLSVLDISASALKQSQSRLDKHSAKVTWLCGDITKYQFNKNFRLVHDRAVFHFLTNEESRKKYIKNISSVLHSGSYFVISTFAEDGPLKCSGLEVIRYSKSKLIKEFEPFFKCIHFKKELHKSPKNMEQKFNYWVFQKI